MTNAAATSPTLESSFQNGWKLARNPVATDPILGGAPYAYTTYVMARDSNAAQLPHGWRSEVTHAAKEITSLDSPVNPGMQALYRLAQQEMLLHKHFTVTPLAHHHTSVFGQFNKDTVAAFKIEYSDPTAPDYGRRAEVVYSGNNRTFTFTTAVHDQTSTPPVAKQLFKDDALTPPQVAAYLGRFKSGLAP